MLFVFENSGTQDADAADLLRVEGSEFVRWLTLEAGFLSRSCDCRS